MLGRSNELTKRRASVRLSVQDRQFQVFAAEIMAPGGNAVRFVDGEQGDTAAFQQGKKTAGQQSFRRHVQQIQLAAQQRLLHLSRGFGVQ